MLGKRGPYAGKFQQRRKRAKYVRSQGIGLLTKQYGPGYQPGSRVGGVSPELMHYTTGLNLVALDTAPASTNPAYYHITTLNNIAQGDTGDGRKGNKIQLKRITTRIKVEVDPNSDGLYTNLVANGHVFRIIMYLDLRPNGAAPGWSEMFDTQPVNSGQLYDYNNPYQRDRFKILADKFVTVPPSYMLYDGENYHSGGNVKFCKFSVPLDCATWFSDGTNNLASIQQNNIGLWIASDASSSAYSTMKFSYRSKLRYHDF